MASIPTSTRETSSGFTLIELTLVMLILGVMLSLAVPRLSRLGEARLESTARRLATMISYLHDEASLRGRIYRLTFDLDHESYVVDVQAPYAATANARRMAAAWDPYAKAAELPVGIEIVEVETADARRDSGSAEMYFTPEDGLGGVTITLASNEGSSLTLDVDGVTGHVRVDAHANADPGRAP